MKTFYHEGDEVELTPYGVEQVGGADNFKYKPAHTGVVVGNQRGNFIKVKRHGRKSTCKYHIVFWVHVNS